MQVSIINSMCNSLLLALNSCLMRLFDLERRFLHWVQSTTKIKMNRSSLWVGPSFGGQGAYDSEGWAMHVVGNGVHAAQTDYTHDSDSDDYYQQSIFQ